CRRRINQSGERKDLFYENETFALNKFDEPLLPNASSGRESDLNSLCRRSGAAWRATTVSQAGGLPGLSAKGQRQWPVFGGSKWDAHAVGGRLSSFFVRQSQSTSSRYLFCEPRLLRHQCGVGRSVV